MKIVTAVQMSELDRQTVCKYGISEKRLIERAGTMAAEWIVQQFDSTIWRILVIAGKGHNGADALVAARYLLKKGFVVQIVKAWQKNVLENTRKVVSQISFLSKKGRLSEKKLLIVDGLFGTGLNRSVEEPFFSLINFLNSLKARVVAIDLPSGLHADTGKPLGAVLSAHDTLTFGLSKLGLVQEHSVNHVGRLHILDIGFPKPLIAKINSPYELLDETNISLFFKARPRSAHKGKLGHVLVLGGSVGFAGASALTARAALRAGAALVSLLVPESIYKIAATLAGPEVMTHPCPDLKQGYHNKNSLKKIKPLLSRATSIVLGPGIGTNPETGYFVEALILACSLPMVLDADALNLVAQKPAILKKSKQELIVTPHPGEMSRLIKMEIKEILKNRFKVAETFSRENQVVVILKGSRTLIAFPKLIKIGEATFRFSINALAGNPGMATGGSGDVLSGILGALLARGLIASDAARAGVFLHARAGDIALSEKGGGIAGDLIEALPQAIASLDE